MNLMDLLRDLEMSNGSFQGQTLNNILNHAKLKVQSVGCYSCMNTGCLCNLYFSLGLNERQIVTWYCVSNPKKTESMKTATAQVLRNFGPWVLQSLYLMSKELRSISVHFPVHFWSPCVSPEPGTPTSPFLHTAWTWTFWDNYRTLFHTSMSSSSWSRSLSADWRRCLPKLNFSKAIVMNSEVNWIYF